MIYVLSYRGKPIAASYNFERLNMATADYDREEQKHLAIREVDIVT